VVQQGAADARQLQRYPVPGNLPCREVAPRLDALGRKTTIAPGPSLPAGVTFGPGGKPCAPSVGFGPKAIGGGETPRFDASYPTFRFRAKTSKMARTTRRP